MIELSDQDILSRLTNTEDSTVERKTANDYRDCLKTAVAFSNSLPVDDPGIIFVGVGNDGTPQDRLNLDSLQKDVSKELSKIYPPIYPQMKVMRRDSKEVLAVIVRGSANRPHFAGQSYIRDGSQTKEASEQQFERLIAERKSKVREILKWKGKQVSLQLPTQQQPLAERLIPKQRKRTAYVNECNEHFATLQIIRLNQPTTYQRCFPLSQIKVSFDAKARRLMLVVTQWY